MEVLEKGNKWSLKEICTGMDCESGCKSKLLVEEEDIFVDSVLNNIDIDYYFAFYCPLCNRKNVINEDKIPLSIQIKLLRKEKQSFAKVLKK